MEEQTQRQKVTLQPMSQAASLSSFAPKRESNTMQSFTSEKEEPSVFKVVFVLLLMAACGIGTGYALATFGGHTAKSVNPAAINADSFQKGQSFGSNDTAAFKDTAQGVVKEGGIDGEGQYHLEREGGASQNVYMTSSTLDLSKFVGKKVKVWGATQSAQTVGWLMDVGKVEIL